MLPEKTADWKHGTKPACEFPSIESDVNYSFLLPEWPQEVCLLRGLDFQYQRHQKFDLACVCAPVLKFQYRRCKFFIFATGETARGVFIVGIGLPIPATPKMPSGLCPSIEIPMLALWILHFCHLSDSERCVYCQYWIPTLATPKLPFSTPLCSGIEIPIPAMQCIAAGNICRGLSKS